MIAPHFNEEQLSLKGAKALDLKSDIQLRSEFVIPTQTELVEKHLPRTEELRDITEKQGEESVYLCGNSLGLLPKRTITRMQQFLSTWGSQGVNGHHFALKDSPLPNWLDSDDKMAEMMAPIVGARSSEVAVMGTLTNNLHTLLSAYYQPETGGRHKIILETKAFPSDHFAVETQILNRGFDPAQSMVCIGPPAKDNPIMTTQYICNEVAKHADSTAILMLPGVQYYSGQLLDIAAITKFAHQHGIFVIWDLAHAAGNVPLQLHDWDVDAAAWCTYKYLNSGPGCIAALFVHDRVSQVGDSGSGSGDSSSTIKGKLPTPRRLGGWWGNDKSTRFAMETEPGFIPVPGAAGFSQSNPPAVGLACIQASLELFHEAGGMGPIRRRSLQLTAYLEALLDNAVPDTLRDLFTIITPRDPEQRGAQLSILLKGNDASVLEKVFESLGKQGVVTDKRKPNVIRVAPAPLYNTFEDLFKFVQAFIKALEESKQAK